jgi:molybdopterin-synthase adenylyltransferase
MWVDDAQFLTSAAQIAAEQFASAGFSRIDERSWIGSLAGRTCQVTLPKNFPFVLPVVRLEALRADGLMAHIDASGVICIAPETGIILDSTNPGGLVTETLERARGVIRNGLNGHLQESIIDEFAAYWSTDAASVWSLCSAGGPTRPIHFGRFTAHDNQSRVLAADSIEALLRWAGTQQLKPSCKPWPGYFVALASAVPLHRHGRVRVAELCGHVRRLLRRDDRSTVTDWTRSRTKLPAWALLGFPTNRQATEHAVVACTIPSAGLVGHRPSTLSLGTALRAAGRLNIQKQRVVRLDAEFLRARGGASNCVQSVEVLLVGAGAVGGFLAQQLLAAGISNLHIIDKDILLPENTYRHLLGMKWVLRKKSEALRDYLIEMYPHAQITAEHADAFDALSLARMSEKSIVVMATGEHTLELRLSAALRSTTKLVHVWLDPFDLGHHILVDGHSGPGCLRCLFEIDSRHGLVNRGSFVGPGQDVTRTMSGCHGTFVPFSALNASAAATDAAECILQRIAGNGCAFLRSRFRSSDCALAAGLSLSRRASLFKPNETKQVAQELPDVACQGCGNRR